MSLIMYCSSGFWGSGSIDDVAPVLKLHYAALGFSQLRSELTVGVHEVPIPNRASMDCHP